jgi:hypothetical protein
MDRVLKRTEYRARGSMRSLQEAKSIASSFMTDRHRIFMSTGGSFDALLVRGVGRLQLICCRSTLRLGDGLGREGLLALCLSFLVLFLLGLSGMDKCAGESRG